MGLDRVQSDLEASGVSAVRCGAETSRDIPAIVFVGHPDDDDDDGDDGDDGEILHDRSHGNIYCCHFAY